MLQLTIDRRKCTQCGQCAQDCPVRVISMDAGIPAIAAGKEGNCLRCQHCLAVCPTAALSILGHRPETGRSLRGNLPKPDQMDILIRGRRSVRRFRDENLPADLVKRLLDVAWQAPTGVNMRGVQFHLIDDRQALAIFREETYAALGVLIDAAKLPSRRSQFADFVRLWREKGVDVLFRGAPHLLVATAHQGCPTPREDCLIALSYFELFARSLDVGTVWNGLVTWAIDELVPDLRVRLGIPADHVLGYVMAFGAPAVDYPRTIDHGPARVTRFTP